MFAISGKCDLNEIEVKSIKSCKQGLSNRGQVQSCPSNNDEVPQSLKDMLGTYKKQEYTKNGKPWYLNQNQHKVSRN